MQDPQYRSLAHCRELLERCVVGELAPKIALFRMLIESCDVDIVARAIDEAVARHALDDTPGRELGRLRKRFEANRALCASLARAARDETLPSMNAEELPSIAMLAAPLLAEDEEPCVPLRALDDATRAHALEEVVAWLDGNRLLTPATRVLDFGCGDGEIAAAIAPRVARIEAVDAQPENTARARARCAAWPNVTVHDEGGGDVPMIEDRAVQLVLAVDCLPRVVHASRDLLHQTMCTFARVLSVGGYLVIVNVACDQPLTDQRKHVDELAKRHGFEVKILALQPFSQWTGAVFLLRRDASRGARARRESWT